MPAQTKSSTAKAPAKKRTTAPKSRTRRRKPAHAVIAERAYFIHLEDGTSDELANWLRAERELMAA
jgi:hypothetical protein